jgi:hypothetical protein
VKKVLLAVSGAFVLAAAACTQTGTGGDPTGTAGASASGAAGTSPSGTAGTSASGSAGTSGSAGAPGNGGSSTPGDAGAIGSAGNDGTAGSSAGDAGATGSAGNNGTAGAGGSTGGSSSGNAGRGGTTGAGGVAGSGSTGRGGTTGGGGVAGNGNAGRGGTTGGGGNGGGGATGTGGAACPTIDQLIPGFDGYLWQVLPSGNTPLSGTNYPFGPPAGGCPQTGTWDQQGYIKSETPLAVKGTTGQKYTINIGVRGVVGTRCYTGGKPGSTAAGNPNGQNNTWYEGGAQYNNSIWNTMELRVSPKVSGQMYQTASSAYDIYFTNSFQNTNGFCEKEATYETRFTASFPVLGGGTITPVVHDSNCRTLANCGSVEQQMTCNTAASRVIDMSGLTPAPTNFTQPRQGSANGSTYQIQWLWIDVTSVTCN